MASVSSRMQLSAEHASTSWSICIEAQRAAGRLEAKREENEQKARRLAEKFADLKKAAEAANQAKEEAWERAKEAGTSAEQCAPVLNPWSARDAVGTELTIASELPYERHGLRCPWHALLPAARLRSNWLPLCTVFYRKADGRALARARPTPPMTLTHAPVDTAGRHADEVLSKTEKHIQQIKDLPPEVKETVRKAGFQDPHAPRQEAQRAEE